MHPVLGELRIRRRNETKPSSRTVPRCEQVTARRADSLEVKVQYCLPERAHELEVLTVDDGPLDRQCHLYAPIDVPAAAEVGLPPPGTLVNLPHLSTHDPDELATGTARRTGDRARQHRDALKWIIEVPERGIDTVGDTSPGNSGFPQISPETPRETRDSPDFPPAQVRTSGHTWTRRREEGGGELAGQPGLPW